MGIVATPKNYWVAPNAISISRNALGEPNRIQANTASGAVILCYIEGITPDPSGAPSVVNGDGLEFDSGHNYRRWPLTIFPTYFNSNEKKYIYVAIPKSSNIGTTATVVFPSEILDIYGKNNDNEQVGSTDYFYIWLQGILSSSGNAGTTPRQWEQPIEWGELKTDSSIQAYKDVDWWGQMINPDGHVRGPLIGDIDYIKFSNGVCIGIAPEDRTLKIYFPNAGGSSSSSSGNENEDADDAANIYATGGVSALGFSPIGSHSPLSLNEPLLSINNSGLAKPGSLQNGKTIVWNNSTEKWEYGDAGGGGTDLDAVWASLSGNSDSFANTKINSAHIPVATGSTVGGIIVGSTLAISNNYLNLKEITVGTPSSGDTTYTKVVVDSYGRVTKATTLSSSDIPALAASKITSGTFDVDRIPNLGWSKITNTPTSLSDYGITDAKISNGTITLGSNSITPLTSFTETDPTVPSWAKQSSKPSYAFSEISGSVDSSQLPIMYWADVAISNASNNNTSPQFGNLRLRPGSSDYGSYLRFGDGSSCYLYEDTDNHLKIYATKGIELVTYSTVSGAKGIDITSAKGIYLKSATALTIESQSGGTELTTAAGSNLTWNTKVIATRQWTEGWVGEQGFLTSESYTGTVTSVGMSVPTGFAISGSPITSSGTLALSFATGYSLPLTADVDKGVTANGWGNHAEAGYWKSGTGNHPTTLSGYGITDALGNGTTFWGQTVSNGAVSGNMTSVGSIASNGEIKTSSANAFRLSYGSYGTILRNDSDYFRILLTASGSADSGSWNALRPFAITLSSGLVSMQNGLHIENANQGNATISGFNALRIGNGVIMWDSTNNAFKIVKYDGTSANIYATGGVSALGFTNPLSSLDAFTISYLNTTDVNISGKANFGTANCYITANSSGAMTINASSGLTLGSSGVTADPMGGLHASKFYLSSNVYLYYDNSEIKVNMNGTIYRLYKISST